jgi:hypothetical protein
MSAASQCLCFGGGDFDGRVLERASSLHAGARKAAVTKAVRGAYRTEICVAADRIPPRVRVRNMLRLGARDYVGADNGRCDLALCFNFGESRHPRPVKHIIG